MHEQTETLLEEIDQRQATLSQQVTVLEDEEAAAAAGDTPLRSLNNSRNASGLSDVTPLEVGFQHLLGKVPSFAERLVC